VGWVTGALGVAPVIAVVLGGALIDAVVVPSIAHLAVITAAATSVTHQTSQLYTMPRTFILVYRSP